MISGVPNLTPTDQITDALGEVIVVLAPRRPWTHHIGELRLMAAVLEDAVHILRKRPRSRAGREAREWLTSRDASWPFAYERICEALNLDPESVRRELVAEQGNTPRLPLALPAFDILGLAQSA
ncbi:MAG TPA: hypothetical protein VLI07_00110 [Candidatus Binatus sp.]|nr:hypothetical protein [Candidatus Binatus sp.]